MFRNVLSAGSDSHIRVFGKDMEVQNTVAYHTEGVNALAVSPKVRLNRNMLSDVLL